MGVVAGQSVRTLRVADQSVRASTVRALRIADQSIRAKSIGRRQSECKSALTVVGQSIRPSSFECGRGLRDLGWIRQLGAVLLSLHAISDRMALYNP